MKNILLLLLALPFLTPSAQAQPGSQPDIWATEPTVRAVVVGISDYRDPLIPDLRFADRDAQAFAAWLRSPAGLALPDSNLRILANREATTAQMIVSLDWLIEASKPGDRAFIYFSGHGDVERVTKFNLGYLLSYDSPSAVYGAGAFSLNYLQAILSTLSENDVQVFIITDACRAGKLAGSSANGTRATATQLAQQFANEIKILSCQPDEFSLEGEQWGGGRGCFSFHLENGLYGFADENHDLSVDLFELRRYLEDHVSREAAPQSQFPMVSGGGKTSIVEVRESEVAARKSARNDHLAEFRAIENKGMESLLLAKADSSIRLLYAKFLAAVDSGQLMSPAGRSANDYFKVLIEKPEIASLHGTMKRKLAAALMDEGQTIINQVLKTDPQVLDNIWANRVHYDHLPAYFERAAEILGEKHYVWRDLKAKEFYFRAMTIRQENYPDSSAEWRSGEKRRLLEKSLEWDSTAAVTYYELGRVDWTSKSLEYYHKASAIAPDWALVHFELAMCLPDRLQAINEFKKAIELDSNFSRSYDRIAWKYDEIGQKDSAIFWRKIYVRKFLQKMAKDSASVKAFECADVGSALWRLQDYEKAKTVLLLGEKISDGKMPWIYNNLTGVYVDLLEFENAIQAYGKTAPKNKSLYNYLGIIYFYFLNDQAKAAEAFEKGENLYDDYYQVEFNFLNGNLSKCRQQAMVLVKGGRNDSHTGFLYYYAAEAARQMGMPDTANFYYRQVIEKASIEFAHSLEAPDWLFVALAYSRLGMEEELRLLLETAKEKLDGDPWLHFYLACFYAQTQQEKAAIASLQKAIELGWLPNPLLWLTGTLCDPMLNPIREGEGYKALMREHFPKYYDIATRVPGKH